MQKTSLQLLGEYAKRVKELDHYNAICEGYYKIDGIIEFGYNKGYLNLKVEARWHPTDKDMKSSCYPVIVSLNALCLRESTGPKEANFKRLKNGILKINKSEIYTYEFNGVQKSSLKVDWEICTFGDEVTEVK